jgi:hypothetical protein
MKKQQEKCPGEALLSRERQHFQRCGFEGIFQILATVSNKLEVNPRL